MRLHDRATDALRPVTFERGYTHFANGSVLARFGETVVLCTASIEETVPVFLKGQGQGWITAEYSLLPGSTPGGRAKRETLRPSGRTQEIQRLIGRSLRMALDLKALGPRTITLDADVLQADGGTRTCAITGCWLALWDALAGLQKQGLITENPLLTQVAAVSVGIVQGELCLDLCYSEDSSAQVDMNVVINGTGDLLEVQATAEKMALSKSQFQDLLDLGIRGATELLALQRHALEL